MTNPVLVEVTRGPLVESRHRGAIAVLDAHGNRRAAIGDIEAGVFSRSSVKLIQALPLVESGAADAFGYGTEELALACASHGGERRHVAIVRRMLEKCGRSAADLECGVQTPSNPGRRQRPGARRRSAELPSQYLLRQACRIRLPCQPSRHRPEGLRRTGSSGPARGRRRARGNDRDASRRRCLRRRRLLDPHLRRAARAAGVCLRPAGNRRGTAAASRRCGASAFRRLHE